MSGLLVVSDLHLHNWWRFATTLRDGTNSRLADQLDVLDQIERYVYQHRPNAIIIPGDLTHRRHYVQFSVYAKLCEWLHRMSHEYAPVIALVGNHDIEARGHHALEPLRCIEGVTVVDDPQYIEIEEYGWAHFIPYMSGEHVVTAARGLQAEDGRRWKPSTIGNADVRAVFLHYVLDGKVLDSEFAVPSPLRLSDLDAFERIYFGHVHAPSVEHDGRVTYLGAPYHMDFGDRGDRYAWHIALDGTTEKLPLNFPRFVTTRYPRVPVCSYEKRGYLRVTGVPIAAVETVQRTATEQGWLACVAIREAVAHDATRTLSSTVFADAESVQRYVDEEYRESDDGYRRALVEYGVSLLDRASE